MDAKINEDVKNKKQDNLITAEIRYKMTSKGMMITEYYGADSCVVLPDEIEGETVTALGDYAFARNLEVEEIWLPEALKEVGRYAFYRCRNLKKLILGNQLLDMGGGALTGCHLEEVEIYFREGKKSCLKSIVEEMRYQIRVSLYGYSWRCCAEKTVQMNGCGKSGFYFRNTMKRRLRTPRQGFLRHAITVRRILPPVLL